MTKIPIVPDYNLIAAEFALGRVLAVTPLAGGAPDVAKLFLPGRICLDPAAAQIAATMRRIAEYHKALKKLPGLLRDPQIWSGPDRPPELLPVVETALGLLRGSLPVMGRLPRQLVHGDIGPDNVLMNGGHGSSCQLPGAPMVLRARPGLSALVFATSCGFQSFKTDKLGRRMTATRSKSVPAGAATQSR